MFLKNHSQVPLQGFIAIKCMFRPLKGLNGLIGTNWVNHRLVGGHHSADLLKKCLGRLMHCSSEGGYHQSRSPMDGWNRREDRLLLVRFRQSKILGLQYMRRSSVPREFGPPHWNGFRFESWVNVRIIGNHGLRLQIRILAHFLNIGPPLPKHLPSNPRASLKETSNTKPSLILLNNIPFITGKIFALIWALSFLNSFRLNFGVDVLPKTDFFFFF